jgi:hypothetical protein
MLRRELDTKMKGGVAALVTALCYVYLVTEVERGLDGGEGRGVNGEGGETKERELISTHGFTQILALKRRNNDLFSAKSTSGTSSIPPLPSIMQSTTLLSFNPQSASPMPPVHLVPSPNTDDSFHR